MSGADKDPISRLLSEIVVWTERLGYRDAMKAIPRHNHGPNRICDQTRRGLPLRERIS
jgi:hypothetical protein